MTPSFFQVKKMTAKSGRGVEKPCSIMILSTFKVADG